jgi:hypothetical protein
VVPLLAEHYLGHFPEFREFLLATFSPQDESAAHPHLVSVNKRFYELSFADRMNNTSPVGIRVAAVVPMGHQFDEGQADSDLWAILRWVIVSVREQWDHDEIDHGRAALPAGRGGDPDHHRSAAAVDQPRPPTVAAVMEPCTPAVTTGATTTGIVSSPRDVALATVRVSGSLDRAGIARLRAELAGWREAGTVVVRLDMSGLHDSGPGMDAAWARAVAWARYQQRELGGQLTVFGATTQLNAALRTADAALRVTMDVVLGQRGAPPVCRPETADQP